MASKHSEHDSKSATSDKSKHGHDEKSANGTSHSTDSKQHNSSSAAQKKGSQKSDKPVASIIDLVVEEHIKVKDQFKQLQTLSDEDGESIYQQLCWDISLHAVAEELVMYPLQERLGEEGKKMAQESRMDHEKTKGILRELDGKKLADHGVREMLGSAMGALVEHINKEEENDLVYLREKLSEQELMDAGRDYQQCKSIIPDIAPSNQVSSEKREDQSEEDGHFKTPMELLLSGKEKIQQILGLDAGTQGNNISGGDKGGSHHGGKSSSGKSTEGNKESSKDHGGKSSSEGDKGDSKSHGGNQGSSKSHGGDQGGSKSHGGDQGGSKSHGGDQGGKSSSGSDKDQGGKSSSGKSGESDKSSGGHGSSHGGKTQEGQEEHHYDLRERDEAGHAHVDVHTGETFPNGGLQSHTGGDDVEMHSQGSKKGGKEGGDQEKNGGSDHGNAKNQGGKREHEEGGEHASKKKAADSRGGQDKMEVDSGSQ